MPSFYGALLSVISLRANKKVSQGSNISLCSKKLPQKKLHNFPPPSTLLNSGSCIRYRTFGVFTNSITFIPNLVKIVYEVQNLKGHTEDIVISGQWIVLLGSFLQITVNVLVRNETSLSRRIVKTHF
jgi:hypothetical protein